VSWVLRNDIQIRSPLFSHKKDEQTNPVMSPRNPKNTDIIQYGSCHRTRYPPIAARAVVIVGSNIVPDHKYFRRSSVVRRTHSRFPVSYLAPQRQTWNSVPTPTSPWSGEGSHQNGAPHCSQRCRQLAIRRAICSRPNKFPFLPHMLFLASRNEASISETQKGGKRSDDPQHCTSSLYHTCPSSFVWITLAFELVSSSMYGQVLFFGS
jgi:hypothetical protein